VYMSSESRTVTQMISLPLPSEKAAVIGPHEIHTLTDPLSKICRRRNVRGEQRIVAGC